MKQRIKPPATLGSALEQVKRKRAALLSNAPPAQAGAPIVEDFDVDKELDWLRFSEAFTTADALKFNNNATAQRVEELIKQDAIGSAVELAFREFENGRMKFLSKGGESNVSPQRRQSAERRGCQQPMRDAATFAREREALSAMGAVEKGTKR